MLVLVQGGERRVAANQDTGAERSGKTPPRAITGDANRPPRVVVVSPTFNEIDALPDHVARVLALGDRYRLVIVDDASPDGTGDLADRLADEYPGRIEVVRRPGKDGLGRAYLAGIRAAMRGDDDLLAMMDADGSHDPGDLPLLARTAEHADIVLGSRYAPGGATVGWPLRRRLLSRLGGRYAGFVLNLPVSDPTSGFRIMRRGAVEKVVDDRVRAVGYAVNLELTWRAVRAGLRVVEVPIVFRERATGESKLTPAIVAEAAGLVWRLRLGGDPAGFRTADRSARRDPAG